MRQRITRPLTREEHGNQENPKRNTFRNNGDGASDRRSFGGRPSRGGFRDRQFGERNSEGSSERRSYGNRPSGGGFRDRQFGERNSEGSSERRSYGNRPSGGGFKSRPFGERNSEGASGRKNFGGRPSSVRNFDRPDRRDSDGRPSERRSYGNRPSGGGFKSRPFGERNAEGASERRNFGGRPSFGRNFDRTSDRKGFDRRDSGKPAFERKYEYKERIPAEPKAAQAVQKVDDGSVRLNKFIANAGVCSRREADEYIAAGLVSVNGKTITEMGVKVFPEKDEVRFNGERIKGEKKVYIIMNKPKDFVTTLSDPHAEKNVMQLISSELCPERVYPVGRLDRSTTGVLLLTNDGEMAEKLTHPSYQKKKIYQVTLDKNLKPGDMELLTSGVDLEDGPAYADEVAYVDGEKSVVGLEIHSGRNRIVRRMFEALGYNVKKLDRVYFAGLTKKNLSRGQWRFLSEEEVTMLKLNFYE